MLLKAALDFGLDLSHCYFVGDKAIDIETIHRVGGKGIHIARGPDTSIKAAYRAHDLKDAVQWILEDIDS